MSTEEKPGIPSTAVLLDWLASQGKRAYLVGGCIRDRLLGRPVHDLDLVVPTGGLALARRIADHFGGDFFPLDEGRGTGRALFRTSQGGRVEVDVAEFRGPDLAADLADRDFAVNALAEDLADPGSIIDLFHGMEDLHARVLHPVGPDSILNDPIRALRGVRLAAELGFSLSAEAVRQIRRDGPSLCRAAGERIRDEVSRILLAPDSAHSLRRLDDLGLLVVVFPALEPLRGQVQSAPHHFSEPAHSLDRVEGLESLLVPVLSGSPGNPLDARAAEQRLWWERLGPLTADLRQHLRQEIGDRRPRLVALKLAALLTEAGRLRGAAEDAASRLAFGGHEAQGLDQAGDAMRRLRFTAAEVRLVESVPRHSMRWLLLASQVAAGSQEEGARAPTCRPPARAVYRFYRDTGGAGVDVLLLDLADHLSTRKPGTDLDAWQPLVDLAVTLLGDYFLHRLERVAPPSLLNGHDLQRELGLAAGPRIGELLEAIREAQVSGEVADREGALALARRAVRHPG